MGRRSRQRLKAPAGEFEAPSSEYRDPEAGVLVLRGSMTPASRLRYAETLRGGLNREDAWQRATELLFEQLAASWTIAGVRTERQRELLARYRAATQSERAFVRDALRAHLRDHFPELEAP